MAVIVLGEKGKIGCRSWKEQEKRLRKKMQKRSEKEKSEGKEDESEKNE